MTYVADSIVSDDWGCTDKWPASQSLRSQLVLRNRFTLGIVHKIGIFCRSCIECCQKQENITNIYKARFSWLQTVQGLSKFSRFVSRLNDCKAFRVSIFDVKKCSGGGQLRWSRRQWFLSCSMNTKLASLSVQFVFNFISINATFFIGFISLVGQLVSLTVSVFFSESIIHILGIISLFKKCVRL